MNDNDDCNLEGIPSWEEDVRGDEALRLINVDAPVLRTQAGPGTGKTFCLVRRVERLLHPEGRDAAGSSVLVVAFNRVIAKELRQDIEERLNAVSISKKPEISTVHALCLRVLGEEFRLLLPHERDAMLYDVLESYTELRERYGPQAFHGAAQALHDHEAKHEDHPTLWMAVREWLDRHGAAMIGDLPRELLHHVQQGDYGGRKYEYVIVDEFQDLTAAEQELFFRLRAESGQFLGLGDSRQSIYRFRGNDREGLRSLDRWAEEVGLDVVDIPLRLCQRCPPEIVEAANQLMALFDEESMEPIREARAEISVVHWPTHVSEAKGMARRIAKDLEEHETGSRVLVMTTRREFGLLLRDEIHALDVGISVDLGFEEGLLDTWPVREAFTFFSLLADPDAATWRAWFAYQEPGGNGSPDAPRRNADAYLRFLASADDRIDENTVLRLAAEQRTKRRGAGGTRIWDRAVRYRELVTSLGDWRSLSGRELVEVVFDEGRWAVSEWRDSDRAALDMKLLREKSFDILEDVLEDGGYDVRKQLSEVARRLRQKIATREPFEADEEADVQITTLWGGKGVTADHVYVLGLCDEAIPGERRETYPGTDLAYIKEQRRLFYVSITRAKKTLVLSRPRKVQFGDVKRLGLRMGRGGRHWVTLQVTRFLREIESWLPGAVDGETWMGGEQRS